MTVASWLVVAHVATSLLLLAVLLAVIVLQRVVRQVRERPGRSSSATGQPGGTGPTTQEQRLSGRRSKGHASRA